MLTLNEMVIRLINERLGFFKGNQLRAAQSLGISRTTLRKYMGTQYYKHRSKVNELRTRGIV